SASGMYRNDGSTRPRWTVDWYSYSVLVPSDGVHLIRCGPWASSTSDEAFTIFASGQLVKSYKVGDLVDTTAFLQHTVSHFFWEQEMRLDEARARLIVRTLGGESYVFDY